MSNSKLRIGFIGLGALGEGLCHNLVKAGYAVTVNDLNKKLAERLIAGGATWSDDVAGTCRDADVVITVLPSPAVSRKVVEGPGGVFENLKSGGTWPIRAKSPCWWAASKALLSACKMCWPPWAEKSFTCARWAMPRWSRS